MPVLIDEIFNPANSVYKPPPMVYWQYIGMERKYGIQINWVTSQEEKNIYYTIDMHCPKMINENAVWEITKDNFYIDNEKSEDSISLLAIECTKPFYPFEFTAFKNGQIQNIISADKLQNRFAEAKPLLLRNYEGEIATEYITAVENVLKDPEQLKTIVLKGSWLSLFFAPIVGEYDIETKTKELSIELPFIGFEESLLFKGLARISSKTKDTIRIVFQGSLLQPAIVGDIQVQEGKVEVTYDLDIDTYHIKNIMCDVQLNTLQGEYSISINGYKIRKKQIVQVKEEKSKTKPVGWLAFFSKD